MLTCAWQTQRFAKTGRHVAYTAKRSPANADRTAASRGRRHARSLGRPGPSPASDLRRYPRRSRAARFTREGGLGIEAVRRADFAVTRARAIRAGAEPASFSEKLDRVMIKMTGSLCCAMATCAGCFDRVRGRGHAPEAATERRSHRMAPVDARCLPRRLPAVCSGSRRRGRPGDHPGR